jgi:hypothetical protein
VRLTGVGFDELVSAVIQFRQRHSDLCGGAQKSERTVVLDDLREFYCRNYKQNCAGGHSTPIAQVGGIGVGTSYVTPINRAADWLAQIRHRRLEHADAALAAERAKICAQCPQNVRWHTSCGPCNDNISVGIQNAKGSLATPFDRHLQVCRCYGWLNEVSVWLKDGHAHSEQQVPSHCWTITEKRNENPSQ